MKCDLGNWQTVDPSLLVGDVKSIIEWFKKISKNKTLDSDCLVFLEPNLEFQLKNKTAEDKKHIRIIFDLESRPQNADEEKDYFVDFEFTNKELTDIVAELEKELDKYSERAM